MLVAPENISSMLSADQVGALHAPGGGEVQSTSGLSACPKTTIHDVKLSDGTAPLGGGICHASCTLELTGTSALTDNLATAYDVDMVIASKNEASQRAMVSGNRGMGDARSVFASMLDGPTTDFFRAGMGGGIFHVGRYLSFDSTAVVAKNLASDSGGGIYVGGQNSEMRTRVQLHSSDTDNENDQAPSLSRQGGDSELVRIEQNRAGHSGGGIHVEIPLPSKGIFRSSVSRQTPRLPSVVQKLSAGVELAAMRVLKNYAPHGGGLAVIGGITTVTSVDLENNVASSVPYLENLPPALEKEPPEPEGGGMRIEKASVVFKDTEIRDNAAVGGIASRGGGLYSMGAILLHCGAQGTHPPSDPKEWIQEKQLYGNGLKTDSSSSATNTSRSSFWSHLRIFRNLAKQGGGVYLGNSQIEVLDAFKLSESSAFFQHELNSTRSKQITRRRRRRNLGFTHRRRLGNMSDSILSPSSSDMNMSPSSSSKITVASPSSSKVSKVSNSSSSSSPSPSPSGQNSNEKTMWSPSSFSASENSASGTSPSSSSASDGIDFVGESPSPTRAESGNGSVPSIFLPSEILSIDTEGTCSDAWGSTGAAHMSVFGNLAFDLIEVDPSSDVIATAEAILSTLDAANGQSGDFSLDNAQYGQGGNMYIDAIGKSSEAVEITNAVIVLGRATEGGGIYVRENARLNLRASLVGQNKAARGGGLDIRMGAEVNIADILLFGNVVYRSLTTQWGGNGGGVAFYNSDVSAKVSGKVSIQTSILRANKAAIAGAALASSRVDIIELSHLLLEMNEAISGGAALFDDCPGVTLKEVVFRHNRATGSLGGGAVRCTTSGIGITGPRDAPMRASTNVVGSGVWFLENVADSGDGGALNILEAVSSSEVKNPQVIGGAPGISSFVFKQHSVKPTFKVISLVGGPKHRSAIGHSYTEGDEISILGGDLVGKIRVTKVSTGDTLNNIPAGGIVEWQVVKTGSSYIHYGRKGEYEVRNARIGSKGRGLTAVVIEATVQMGPIGPLGSEITMTLDAIHHQGEAEKDRRSRDVQPCSGGSVADASSTFGEEEGREEEEKKEDKADVPMCVFDSSVTRTLVSSHSREDELKAGVLFTGNTALRGGAIALTGSTVKGAVNFGRAGRGIVVDNEATQSGGGVYIGVAGDGVATLRNLDIIGCRSSGTSLAPADGGGGLYVGGSYVEKSPAFIGDVLFRNNRARGFGGGVFTRNAGLKFETNTQVQVYKINPEKPKETIVVLEDVPIVTRFVNNRANAGGGLASDGSIVELANSIFVANLAEARGGSIMVTRDPVMLAARGGLSEADLVANPFLRQALTGNTITIEGGMAGQFGGAICVTNLLDSSIVVDNLVIGADLARIPSASILAAAAIRVANNPSTAASAAENPKAVLTDTVHATKGTAGVLGSNGFQEAASLLKFSPKFKAAFPSASQYGGSIYVSSVNAVRFKRLRSMGSSSAGDGGTIYVVSCPHFEILDSDLSGGSADFGGAVVVDRGSVLHVKGSRLRENTAEFDGGAICTRENAVVDLEQTVFERNLAKTGGAIYVDTQGSVRRSDECVFRDNFAHMFGGAVVLTLSTDMTVTRSTFWGNKANDDGGAIFTSDSKLVVVDTQFHYNAVKSRHGGAVLAERGTVASFDSCEFKGNVVRDAGGGGALAIRNHAQIRMSQCVLDRNRAGFGGAVFINHNAKVYFARVIIKANIVSDRMGNDNAGAEAGAEKKSNAVSSASSEVGQGAGIFAGAYSTVDLSDGTVVKDNVALARGGGLYLDANARLVIHDGISREAIKRRVLSQEAAWETAKAGMDSQMWRKEALKWPWKEYLPNGNEALGGTAHGLTSRLGPNRVNIIAAEQAIRAAMKEADVSSSAASGTYVFGLSRDGFKTQYGGETCLFERNEAGEAGGAVYLTHIECDTFTDDSVSTEFGKWTPPCLREGPGCSQNFRGTVERSICVDVTDTQFRNNEAALGGAVFWRYIWNGKEFPVFTCDGCDNDIKNSQSGWNDIATDAIGVGLGWFPNLETFESGARLEDRSGIDALRVGHTYVRTMRCDEIGVQQPVLDLAIARMCRDQGFDGSQCAVFYQSLHPAYERQVCTYFGWLPLGNVERADDSLLDKHRVNVDNGCQKLRDELIYGGVECDEHCFRFGKGKVHVGSSSSGGDSTSSSPATASAEVGVQQESEVGALPPLFQLSRPLDGVCGLEREMQITDTGETIWSVTSRRCNIATRKYETCKMSATNTNNNDNVVSGNLNANQVLSQCETIYALECPKICRKSERLTCAELSAELEQLTLKNIAKTAKQASGNVGKDADNAAAFVSTFAFLRSVDDFRLPLGPYVKALDYYGNPVTIDDSTRCTLIRHHREVPQAPSEAVLELLRAENNGTLPEGVLTAEEIAELYAAPQLKLKNVEQTANNGVIDFSSLDYSAFPVVSQGTALQVRGEIGFSYNLSFSCVNSLPIDLEPIHVEMRIGQCQPGKALDLKQQCTRCRAGRYSPSGSACLDCPIGAICEMPCPVDEACEGSVGTTFPLTDIGYWENMGPRDLIEGEIQGVPIGMNAEDVVQRDRASNAWWNEMHTKQGIRTDEDSDIGLEQVTGIGDQKRRLVTLGGVFQPTSRERLARRLGRAPLGRTLRIGRFLQGEGADNATRISVSNQSVMTTADNDDMINAATSGATRNGTSVLPSLEELAAIEVIRLRQEKAAETAATTRSRSLLTDVLRTLYSIQGAITLEIFQGADLDSDGQISIGKSRETVCRAFPKNVRTMLGWKGKQRSNECQRARRKKFVDGKAIASKDEFSSTCWHDEREFVDDPDAGLRPNKDCVMWHDWGVTETQRMAVLLYREAPSTAPRRGKQRHRAQTDRAHFMAPAKGSGVSQKPLWYHESKFWYEEWDQCKLCETGIKAEVDSCPLGTTPIAEGLVCCSQETDPWGLKLSWTSPEEDCGGIATVSQWALRTETPHGFSIVLERDTSRDGDPSNRVTASMNVEALQAQVMPLCRARSQKLSSERIVSERTRHTEVLASIQRDKTVETQLHENELKVIKDCAECFKPADDSSPKVFCHREDFTSGCEAQSQDACLGSLSAFKLVQKKTQCTTASREKARHNNALAKFVEREAAEDLRSRTFSNNVDSRRGLEEGLCIMDLSTILPVKAAEAWDKQRVSDCFCSTPSLRPSWMKENRLNGIRSYYMPRDSHDIGRKANLAAFPGGSAGPKLELIDPETGQASDGEGTIVDWARIVDDLETLRKTEDEFDMKCLFPSGRCVGDEESKTNKMKLMASEKAWMDAMDRFMEESVSTIESFDLDGDGNIRYEEFVESVNYRMDQSYEEIAAISLDLQQQSTVSDDDSTCCKR